MAELSREARLGLVVVAGTVVMLAEALGAFALWWWAFYDMTPHVALAAWMTWLALTCVGVAGLVEFWPKQEDDGG